VAGIGGRNQPLTTRWAENIPEIPLNSYPRPQFMRPRWLCLNGRWEFDIAPSGVIPQKMVDTILVPFSPETALSSAKRGPRPWETAWYSRSFSLPDGFLKDRLLLHFGAVDQWCEVFINGKSAGTHLGGYTPFYLDITGLIVPEGENRLTVSVRDQTEDGSCTYGKQSSRPRGIWYTAQSGIWQTVWLESVPEHYISDVRITPVVSESKVCLQLPDSEPGDEYAVLAEGKLVCRGSFDEKGYAEVVLPDCRLWTPETPFLYDLLLHRGSDLVKCYFAMRSLEIHNDTLELNGKPVFLSGLLDQGYWPESLYTPPCDEAMVEDIQAAKDMGFNLLRKHVKVEPLRWYYHCDRLGMLVWQDIPSGGDYSFLGMTLLPTLGVRRKDTDSRRLGRRFESGRRQFPEEVRELIHTLYNSPCVICWSLFNEGWGQFQSADLTAQVKEWDSTRLIDPASGWFDQHGGDFCSRHIYFRDLTLKADPRVQAITEFGGFRLSVPEHSAAGKGFGYRNMRSGEQLAKALTRVYRDKLPALRAKGLQVSILTQLTDVENELNGLLTWDRRICKLDKEQMKSLNEALLRGKDEE